MAGRNSRSGQLFDFAAVLDLQDAGRFEFVEAFHGESGDVKFEAGGRSSSVMAEGAFAEPIMAKILLKSSD